MLCYNSSMVNFAQDVSIFFSLPLIIINLGTKLDLWNTVQRIIIATEFIPTLSRRI